MDYLLDQARVRTRENEQILRTFPNSWQNNEVLRKKSWLAGNDRIVQVDGPGKGASAFSRHEQEFARLFIRRDERAGKIWWNAAAPAADARRGPGDRFGQNIFAVEDGGKPRWQRDR